MQPRDRTQDCDAVGIVASTPPPSPPPIPRGYIPGVAMTWRPWRIRWIASSRCKHRINAKDMT